MHARRRITRTQFFFPGWNSVKKKSINITTTCCFPTSVDINYGNFIKWIMCNAILFYIVCAFFFGFSRERFRYDMADIWVISPPVLSPFFFHSQSILNLTCEVDEKTWRKKSSDILEDVVGECIWVVKRIRTYVQQIYRVFFTTGQLTTN